jgi:hypothetical protein
MNYRYAELEELVFCHTEARERIRNRTFIADEGESGANQSRPTPSILHHKAFLAIDLSADILPKA